jgi:RNA polymerase sigma factor (sigma-70 family)
MTATSLPSSGPAPESSGQITTFHVRRAREGDQASLQWLVERLTPVLVAQASFRLGPSLGPYYDPEDPVNDVWAITIPKLQELTEREGRITPVLLRFMTTTITYRTNDLLKKHVAENAARHRSSPASSSGHPDTLGNVADSESGVVTGAVRGERRDLVSQALQELDPIDREVLLLRGIEQNSNASVALLLGLAPNSVSMRYLRALKRLRARLPGSVFDEIPGEQE